MKYDLTEKLHFDSDPILVIKDTELTIKSDAEVVLELMDIMMNNGEFAAAKLAMPLLLSEKDQKKLEKLHLKMNDYVEVMMAAASLAMGEDPSEPEASGEE